MLENLGRLLKSLWVVEGFFTIWVSMLDWTNLTAFYKEKGNIFPLLSSIFSDFATLSYNSFRIAHAIKAGYEVFTRYQGIILTPLTENTRVISTWPSPYLSGRLCLEKDLALSPEQLHDNQSANKIRVVFLAHNKIGNRTAHQTAQDTLRLRLALQDIAPYVATSYMLEPLSEIEYTWKIFINENH